jgi:hypothetical protein
VLTTPIDEDVPMFLFGQLSMKDSSGNSRKKKIEHSYLRSLHAWRQCRWTWYASGQTPQLWKIETRVESCEKQEGVAIRRKRKLATPIP